MSDFATVVLTCKVGALPFHHKIHYTDTIPDHLVPDETWGAALGDSGVGPLKSPAQKVVNKIGSLFEQRRYLVGHVFFTPGLDQWHFIYFDQRDTESQRQNHWKGGAHIHLVNWLWPNIDPRTVWTEFVEHRKVPGGALHIRFDDVSQPGTSESA